MITDNFCCIGAELQKREFSEYSSPQIYYYRSASDEETLDVMLSDNFFNPINEKVNKDDIIFMYSIEEKIIAWGKVVSNQGGIVKIERVEVDNEYISKIVPMLKLFGARTNIFETSTDLQPLNQDVLGQKQYTNIATDKFTRIPVKTYEEDNENIEQDTLDFQFLQVGSLVVDTFGTLGIVEVLQNDGVEYTNISITTLIMGNTANKTTDFISPINDTNKGLTNNEANTSVSADNKIATMTEINAITNGNYLGKSYWFGKTTSGFTVPNPTMKEQNYIDFTTNEVYTAKEDLSGWDLQETITPVNTEMILITSAFWDIPENGYPGTAIYSDTTSWSYFPRKAGRGDNITITEKQPDGALTVVKDYFGFRKENTAYELGDKVSCAYHPDLMLECGVAGTTSNIELDTRGELSTGDTITDGTVTWNVVDIGSGGGLEVGDIGISPFVDEGKNLRRYLNGQVILQSQFAGFATKLKKAVQTYPNLATTEDNWQAIKSNSKIGQCGKFVIDDTAGTIRLPCIVKLQGVLNLGNIGSIVDDGLPSHTHTRGDMNITGTYATRGLENSKTTVTGAFYNAGTSASGAEGDQQTGTTIGFDASRSWTGNTSTGNYSSDLATTNTVQEEAIQYPYFIQVANGYVEDVNIDMVASKLNNDFSNAVFPIKGDGVIVQSTREDHVYFLGGTNLVDGAVLDLRGKNADYPGAFTLRSALNGGWQDLIGYPNGSLTWRGQSIAAMGMPSGKYVDLTLGASNSDYTAPANGYFYFAKIAGGNSAICAMKNTTAQISTQVNGAGGSWLRAYIPAKKGDVIKVEYTATGDTQAFSFIYAEGDNIGG